MVMMTGAEPLTGDAVRVKGDDVMDRQYGIGLWI
jgi:hypothetical protein